MVSDLSEKAIAQGDGTQVADTGEDPREVPSDDCPLTQAVERVRSVATDGEVSVGTIVAAVEDNGVLPAILLPALVAATPLSGIPGVSVVCGLLIALLSLQLILRAKHLYLPGRLKRFTIDGAKLRTTMEKVEPVTRWIDRHTGDRLSFLFHRPMIWVPQALCLMSGMAMPFLEFIPFSSSVAATGVCLLVMAMLTRDGLFAILALIPYSGAVYLLVKVLG